MSLRDDIFSCLGSEWMTAEQIAAELGVAIERVGYIVAHCAEMGHLRASQDRFHRLKYAASRLAMICETDRKRPAPRFALPLDKEKHLI